MRRTPWELLATKALALVAVTAVALGGCGKTDFSQPAEPVAPVLDNTAPDDVTNFTATPGPNAGEVTLTWTPSVSPDALQYILVTTPLSLPVLPTVTIAPATTATFVVAGLAAGVSHSFFMQTEDGSGNLSPGVLATALPAALQDVTGAVAIPGNTQVILQWLPSASPGVVSYNVLVTPQGSPALPVINVTPGSATGTTVTGLTNGILHTFLITAIDGNNNSSAGVIVSATPTAALDTQPPTNVSNLTATPVSAQVTLAWTPATDNVAVVSYTVQVTDLTLGPPTIINTLTITPGTITGTVVTGLTNGVGYRFTVIANDSAGNTSAPGVFVDATPGNPAVTTAVPQPGGAYRTANAPSVSINGLSSGTLGTGGVIYYTVDGSNPIAFGASAPNANGVTPSGATATMIQAVPLTIPLTMSAALVTTQFGPSTAGTSTPSTVTLASGSFPLDGSIRAGDTVRITAGTAVGETQTIINGGVSASTLSVGGTFSAAPTASTFVVERGNRAVVVRAFYDPAGIITQTSATTSAGVTATFRYFFFTQAQDTFVPYGGMISPRFHHTSTLLTSGPASLIGSVMLLGGETGAAQIESIFDRGTEFFFRGGSVPGTQRQEHTTTRLDDANQRLLIAGGRGGLQGSVRGVLGLATDLNTGANSAEEFDPLTNTFTDRSTAFNPRTLGSATLLTGRVGGAGFANDVLVTGGVSATPNVTFPGSAVPFVPVNHFRADASSGTSSVIHAVGSGVIAVGDILEVTTGAAAGESAVVIAINTAPIGAVQNVAVSPAFSVSVAGATIRALTITDTDAQLFNPNTNTWTTLTGAGTAPTALIFAGGVNQRRWGHAAVLLQNGLVVIGGGHIEAPVSGTNDIEKTLLVFDSTDTTNDGAGSFRIAGSGGATGFQDNSARLADSRFFLTGTLLADGKVLFAGGMKSGAGYWTNNHRTATLQATADLFDPSNETTTAIGGMKASRAFHTGTLLNDGRVLMTGGAVAVDSQSGVPIRTSSAELYDPLTRSFQSTSGGMLTRRIYHDAVRLPDGRVLVTGGAGNALPEIFDPATGVFAATAGTATADRSFGGSVVVLNSGNLLVTGGQTSNDTVSGSGVVPGVIGATSEVYQTDLSLFLLTPAMQDARRFHTSTLLDDGQVLVVGGEGHAAGATTTPTALASAEMYDETTDAYTTLNPMSGGRYDHTATKLNAYVRHTTGTVSLDGTTAVTGTGTTWQTDGVQVGDRIRLDSNGAYFEIATITSDTALTITGAIGGFFPAAAIPGTVPTPATGNYTIYSQTPYTVGTASFSFGLNGVTGTGTNWTRTVRTGDLVRPTGAGAATTTYTVQSVTSDTSLTLTTAFGGISVVAGTYTVASPGKVLVIGGGPAGSPLSTGEIFDPVIANWQSVNNQMSQGRYAHTASLLNNGWVVIVGGNNNFDRTAELYDPAMNRFAQISVAFLGTAITQAARNNHESATLADGNVFICGGDIAQAICELFTPDSDNNATVDADSDGFSTMDFVTNPFSQFSNSMSVGRVNHTVTVLQPSTTGGAVSQILVVGGKGSATVTADLFDYLGNSTIAAPAAITLGRLNGTEFHMAARLPTTDNVWVTDGHTVQIFFSR